MANDANTTGAEYHELTAKSHRAVASYHEKADATGEHKHCAEGVKHSGMAHKVWVAVRRADSKMKM